MMTICFYAPLCAPKMCFNELITHLMTGNILRKILRSHIDNHRVLSVSFFPKFTKAEAFRREFIEPCIGKDGYPQAGMYHTKSQLLNGEEVDYLVNVIPYSDRLRDAPNRSGCLVGVEIGNLLRYLKGE